MTRLKLIGVAPQLIVSDLVQTAEYYRDVLGFAIIGYFPDLPVYAIAKEMNSSYTLEKWMPILK